MTSTFGENSGESRGRRRVVSASSLSASSLLYVTLTLACLYDSQHKTMGMNGGGDATMERGGVGGWGWKGGAASSYSSSLCISDALWRQCSLVCVIIHTVSNQPSTPPPPPRPRHPPLWLTRRSPAATDDQGSSLMTQWNGRVLHT